MVMHAKDFKDDTDRWVVATVFDDLGYDVINPILETYKVGDLFIFGDDISNDFDELGFPDHETPIVILEVEQMGKDREDPDKVRKYVPTMRSLAQGEIIPTGIWKTGFSVVPRKLKKDYNQKHIEELKKKYGIVCDDILEWSMYARITPDRDGLFVASRYDIGGPDTIRTKNTPNGKKIKEKSPSIPWDKVVYVDLEKYNFPTLEEQR